VCRLFVIAFSYAVTAVLASTKLKIPLLQKAKSQRWRKVELADKNGQSFFGLAVSLIEGFPDIGWRAQPQRSETAPIHASGMAPARPQ